MTTDLAWSLRKLASELCVDDTAPWLTLREAADEIDRLRTLVGQMDAGIKGARMALDSLLVASVPLPSGVTAAPAPAAPILRMRTMDDEICIAALQAENSRLRKWIESKC